MLAGYEHFLALARSVQWTEAEIDLSHDAATWAAVPAPQRHRIAALLAGFQVGEAAVAQELRPFDAAADAPLAGAAFRAQAVDEDRHARFFQRVAVEVIGEERRAAPAGFTELFEHRLPALADALARADARLHDAVGLYHMVLEGTVFTAGQIALVALLDEAQLPGLRRGVELVLRDERWHIGFGTRCLLDARVGGATLANLREESERAMRVWGGVIPPDTAEAVLRVLRRRLALIASA